MSTSLAPVALVRDWGARALSSVVVAMACFACNAAPVMWNSDEWTVKTELVDTAGPRSRGTVEALRFPYLQQDWDVVAWMFYVPPAETKGTGQYYLLVVDNSPPAAQVSSVEAAGRSLEFSTTTSDGYGTTLISLGNRDALRELGTSVSALLKSADGSAERIVVPADYMELALQEGT